MTKIDTQRLTKLADEIRKEVASAEADFQSALQHAIKAGENLIEAKRLVKHGDWLHWLEANFPGTDRTASNYMRLASNQKRVSDLPTVRDALALLASPKPEPPEPEPPAELEFFEPIPLDLPEFAKGVVTTENLSRAVAASQAAEAQTVEGQEFLSSIASLSEHAQQRLLVRRLVDGWDEHATNFLRDIIERGA